jgi:hypothetical protein
VCVVMVILVTWEDEIRRIMVPGQIIFEIAWANWTGSLTQVVESQSPNPSPSKQTNKNQNLISNLAKKFYNREIITFQILLNLLIQGTIMHGLNHGHFMKLTDIRLILPKVFIHKYYMCY